MTPIKEAIRTIQERIDEQKKSMNNHELMIILLELKESLTTAANAERERIILAFDNGKFSTRFADGEEYYNKMFSE